ncbi:NADPH-dependent FMN reductase [Microlunatus soli]|uniref:FMN reductase n=1 Tax=Microlunatus soli TaxID=630515 RepID=A0A1H1PIN8_9ACTN|nr:NAD(P)H-dependent oxidoreductase [Microlunatus soli]SDS11138.1 FMN reductase [Microlunatus soli]
MTTPQPATAGAPPVVVVSGNPRPGSRTLRVGRAVGEAVAGSIGADHGDPAVSVADIEVSAFGADLFVAPDARPAALLDALQTIRTASLLVVATPVYKASYTGLLKAFLDHYQAGELSSVVAIPVVVAGGPAHTFVGELYLRPLLTELGAVLPTPAFTITEGQLPELATVAADWAGRYGDVLARQLAGATGSDPGRREALGVAGG